MLRKLLFATTLVLLLPALLFAQDGKLRGKVTDSQSGEPLIGANVVVDGTSLGASTDLNGDYIILSVPPGVYSVRTSYIGYAPVTISNVRVNANITTTQDFALTSSAIQVEAVEVVADRPLIQRNTTNTVRVTTSEDIKNIPFRGLQNILALEAGVVQQNGNLHLRGGRSDEVTFYLEGANTTNPLNNAQTVPVIQEAIEEIQIQAGGYTAEIGGGNAGVVRTAMRSGTPDYRASIDIQTDDFAKPGSAYFGSSSFGFRNIVGTVSGPVPGVNNLKFFLAGQHNYIRDRNQRFLTPFRFEGLRVDENDARYRRDANGVGLPADSQAFLPGPIEFKENYVPGSSDMNNSLQGTASYDFTPFKVRLSGSYSQRVAPSGTTWPRALDRVYRQRNAELENETAFIEGRFTHVLDAKTFYEVGASYQRIKNKTFDPDKPSGGPLPTLMVGGQPFRPNFRDGWNGYSDSLGYSLQNGYEFRRRFAGPNAWSTINGFQFDDPGAPVLSYARSQQDGIGFTADFTSQVSSTYELKVGGRLETWTARNYSVANISTALEYLYGTDGKSPRSFTSLEQLSVEVAKNNINHYGYDVFGQRVDDGVNGPKKPLFASAYIQNKFEYSDLILNVGVRLEHFDTKGKTMTDPTDRDGVFNLALDVVDESKLVDAEAFTVVLPRISFSFPVTENTVFYAMYGKYAQMPSLNQLYVGNTILSRTLSTISGGNAFLTPVGYFMRPQRTTQYEIGFRQTIVDNLAFTATGFYRDLKDQLAVRFLVDSRGVPLYQAYLNDDFGTVKGLEFTLELRRTNRLAAKVSYTASDARGTGSNPRSAWGAIEQGIGRPTNFINPLDFNQTHRGTVSFDYRWGRGDGGPVLEGLGVNALLTFNSGHAYTKIKEPSELGQANPWNVGIRPLIDPRSSFPVEPINASTTPWVFNVDLNVSKTFWVGAVTLDVYANILNLFNTKHVLNVYPSTGTPYDDGWLTSAQAGQFNAIPNYTDFYRAINLDNQYYYQRATGNEMFGAPRQVRFGVRVGF